MKKAYIYEVVTAVLLLLVVETYFWTQGRTLILANASMKALLIGLYVALAALSQAVISSALRYGVRGALKTNVLVAVIVSGGLTLLGLSIHPGILKDVPADWTNAVIASLKFFGTIGLATFLLRIIVAALSVRINL